MLKAPISCHRQTYQNYEQPPQTWQLSDFQTHFSAFKIKEIFLVVFFPWRILDYETQLLLMTFSENF